MFHEFLNCFITEKTVERREEDLPWEVPLPFDPSFLPTSVYKSVLDSTLQFNSSSVQNAPGPYYSHSSSNDIPMYKSKKIANMDTSGYGSDCVSGPINAQLCLSQARETSNSCPTISVPDRTLISGNAIEMPSTSTGAAKLLPPIGVFWDIENCAVSFF